MLIFCGTLGLFCALINFFIGISLLISIKKQEIKTTRNLHYIVTLFSFLGGIWCLFRGLQLLSQPENYLILERICLTTALFLTSTAILLSYTLQGIDLKFSRIGLIYLPAILLAIIGFSNTGIKEIISVCPLKRVTGQGYKFVSLWISFSIFWVLYKTIKGYQNLKGIRKLQIQYFIIGFSITLAIGAILGGILPLFGYDVLIPLIPYSVTLFIIASSYITSKQPVDIEVFIYKILGFSSAPLLFALLILVFWFLLRNFIYLQSQIAFLISIITTAILYISLPVKERVNTTLENIILRKKIKYQNLLKETSSALVLILEMDKLLNFVIHSIREAIGCRKIGIFLAQKIEENTIYKLQASYGLSDARTNIFSNKKIIKLLETKREPFILDSFFNLTRDEYEELKKELGEFNILLILPLLIKNELLGFITIDEKKTDGNMFDISDIEILQTLANDLAVAIKNAQLYKELENAYIHITRALSIALETKDAYTIGHSDNVTKYALAIAKRMNLPEKDLLCITQAAMLHDLGKIGVHDYILNKPDKLSPEEWEEIKLHSLKGAEILKPLTSFNEIAEIIKYHHEHYDGSGYPKKLKGSEIPLGARILAVADAFDAMISDRPYRKEKTKLTVQEALEELKRNKGTQFSPEIVDIFVSVIEENPNIVLSQKSTKKYENA